MLNDLEKKVCLYSNKNLSSYTKREYFQKSTEEFGFNLPYYVKDIVLNDEVFRKIFVVDIRIMSDEQINCIFNYFSYFQISIFPDYYYQQFEKGVFNYRYNMELIFLYDKERNYNLDKYKVLYDTNYVFKRFMEYDELQSYLSRNYEKARFNKFDVIRFEDKNFYMRDFNYIHGNNGSGKTVLLNKLSNRLKVPVFSMDDQSLNLMDYIQDKDNLKNYLYMLTGSYDIRTLSEFEKYIYRLCQILEFSKEHNNILLLDDLRWHSLDVRNKINLIDTLFEHSIDNESVVITGCSDNQKGLVKSRVYRSNIVDL